MLIYGDGNRKIMRFVYGTRNSSKIEHMNNILGGMHIEIEKLPELEEPAETGSDMLENAKIKALHYYKLLKRPVFSCDSGLYFDDVSAVDQPGKHVRRVGGKSLTDEEMTKYYARLAEKYGGSLIARYHNAICLVLDEDHVICCDDETLNSEAFKLISTPHPKRRDGFPLDSLSVDINTGKYYEDLDGYIFEDSQLDKGFRDFFKRVLSPEVVVEFKDFGKIKMVLNPYDAPDTVRNFIHLIKSDYYLDKSICRSVSKRLIQTGDTSLPPTNWTDDTPGYILNGEFNREGYTNPLSFKRGTIGMAMAAAIKTDYATAGSFFIMTKDEEALDEIVPAFGRVFEGMDVIDKINEVSTHKEYGYDALVNPILISRMSIDTKGVVYDKPEMVDLNKVNPAD